MQKNIKKGNPFFGMVIESENLCFFGRKVGKPLNRLEKGEQPNIHRHVIQQ
jgi:hypothetical protein